MYFDSFAAIAFAVLSAWLYYLLRSTEKQALKWRERAHDAHIELTEARGIISARGIGLDAKCKEIEVRAEVSRKEVELAYAAVELRDKDIAMERERSSSIHTAMEKRHEREMSHVLELHSKQLTELTNLKVYGQPGGPREAIIDQSEPDAEQRARRAVSESSVQVGVVRLRNEYASAGIDNISDELLEAEVRDMLLNGINLESVRS